MMVAATTPTASRRPYICRGIGPTSTVPFDGLGMNAGGTAGIGGDARAAQPIAGFAETGVVTTRLARLATLVAVLFVAAACTPGGPPPGGPAPTGDQNGSLGSCPVFPADNAWHAAVSTLTLRSTSSAIVNQVLADGPGFLHADFG